MGGGALELSPKDNREVGGKGTADRGKRMWKGLEARVARPVCRIARTLV